MAFIMLATLLLSFSLLRSRLPPRKSGPVVDFSAFRDSAYSIFLICRSSRLPKTSALYEAQLMAKLAVLITYTGLYVPFFYIESYATNIGVRGDMVFYMLIIMNAASVAGRILPPFVADRYKFQRSFPTLCGILM